MRSKADSGWYLVDMTASASTGDKDEELSASRGEAGGTGEARQVGAKYGWARRPALY